MNDKELIALAYVVKVFRKRIGEDTAGVLMYCGAFTFMPEQEMLDLARKIDSIIGPIVAEDEPITNNS